MFQLHVSFLLADHKRQILNLELFSLVSLQSHYLRVDLNVFVLNRELISVDFDLLVSWILNNDILTDTLSNWTG